MEWTANLKTNAGKMMSVIYYADARFSERLKPQIRKITLVVAPTPISDIGINLSKALIP